MSTNNNEDNLGDKTQGAVAATAMAREDIITIDFLRSYPALQKKSKEQLGAVVSKLNDEMIETTFDLENISRETLAGKIPGLVLDALKPVPQVSTQKENDRLIPLLQVLPDLLREVQISRRSRLNCWERESARTTGSKRNAKFRAKVIAFYERASKSNKNVKCQILDEFTPVGEAQEKIIAAHIWKASTRGQALDEFGLHPSDVNDARNGLFLTKGIEDAFDKQQVCFLYNLLECRLILWVADPSIMTQTILGSDKIFSDVHQQPLLCPDGKMPYRRLLSWHARLTLELRQSTLVPENHVSEYDKSPGREHAVVDPISRAINVLVEPGEDASIQNE